MGLKNYIELCDTPIYRIGVFIFEKKKGKTMYAVYDTKNKEQCVGVFDNRAEVAKFFNSNPNSIGTMITLKKKFERRYLIEKVEEDK